MTAREFIEWAGYEVNRKTLFALTQYVAGDIDYSQFPDAEVVTEDGTPLNECAEEPALFQEWVDRFYRSLDGHTRPLGAYPGTMPEERSKK